ncbi:hypothetical protein FHX37_0451 [Haloactinospora alba]|uniref:Uncharacterized protein n=1 Tax=Haloactinospora alba TaxID=405555 RepID=A0A543NFF8_9ACTN|nr:hypothetical protein [Haloactinospora alba]TQN30569.1 hypothetical protein FHX37_0451 [Haloactinospora alba]
MGTIILAGTMVCLAGTVIIALCRIHRRVVRLESAAPPTSRRDLDDELERRVNQRIDAHDTVPHPRRSPERTRGHLSLYRGGAIAAPALVAGAWLRDGVRHHAVATSGTAAVAGTLILGVTLLPAPGDTAPDAAPAPLVTPSADPDQGDTRQQPAPRATPEDVTVTEPRAAPEEHDRAEEQPAPEDGTGGGDQAAEDGGEPEHGQEPEREREHDRAEESDRPPERDEEDDQEPDEDEGRWCVPPHHAESVVDLCLPHELLR